MARHIAINRANLYPSSEPHLVNHPPAISHRCQVLTTTSAIRLIRLLPALLDDHLPRWKRTESRARHEVLFSQIRLFYARTHLFQEKARISGHHGVGGLT